jgi:hypothetical protein
MTCSLARLTYQRYLTQGFLHHPPEISSQKTVNQINIISSLMIADKDIRLVFAQAFPSLYLNGEQAYPAHQTAPYHRRIVTDPSRTNGTEKNYEYCTEDGCNQENGTCYKQLIKPI